MFVIMLVMWLWLPTIINHNYIFLLNLHLFCVNPCNYDDGDWVSKSKSPIAFNVGFMKILRSIIIFVGLGL